MNNYLIYILVMAGVTYLIRMLPLTLVKGKIKSQFIQSFIYYIPYAVLSAMTIPAIFYSTPEPLPSVIGLIGALITAFFTKSLLGVAVCACAATLLGELIMLFL